VTAFNTNTLLL